MDLFDDNFSPGKVDTYFIWSRSEAKNESEGIDTAGGGSDNGYKYSDRKGIKAAAKVISSIEININ